MLVTRILGGCGPSSDLEHADPVADGLVLDHPLGRERFVDGKPHRLQRRKEAQVADQPLDFIQPRTDDHEHGRGLSGQGGRHQRARRPPDSVQRRRMARLQTLDDLREVRQGFDASDQLQEPIGRRRC